MNRAAPAAAVVALALAAGAAAAALGLRSGPLSVFAYPARIVVDVIPASVDVKPETLQRKSEGDHVTVFVTLPDGLGASEIDPASLRLCHGGCVAAGDSRVVSGGRTLKAEFDRGAVIALLADVAAPATVTLTVSGLVSDPPARFSGTDDVKVL